MKLSLLQFSPTAVDFMEPADDIPSIFRSNLHPVCELPYSRKYWRSLNLAVWSQVAEIKILADLNLTVALRSVICHYKHCEHVYQGALPSSCLRYLNKAVSSQIYKKYNWQHINDELAIRTACEKGRRTGPRALQHVLSYALRARPT